MIIFNREKYRKLGYFTLSSGIKSGIYYDFRDLTLHQNKNDFELLKRIIKDLTEKLNIIVVGIHTMGSYITSKIHNSISYYPKIDMINDEKIILSKRKYYVFDDVSTSFKTIKKAINKLGYPPEFVLVLKNRTDINNNTKSFMIFNKEIQIYEINKINQIYKSRLLYLK